ncbi:MAG: hypothetical protein EOP48_00005 [Sphingobacteriales bacterium]|nr:MAG: hypothetical protein EOP48_00005 [Sphingobacteriales bacterium]
MLNLFQHQLCIRSIFSIVKNINNIVQIDNENKSLRSLPAGRQFVSFQLNIKMRLLHFIRNDENVLE